MTVIHVSILSSNVDNNLQMHSTSINDGIVSNDKVLIPDSINGLICCK